MIQCSQCGKNFANKQSLSSHKYRYHRKDVGTKNSDNSKDTTNIGSHTDTGSDYIDYPSSSTNHTVLDNKIKRQLSDDTSSNAYSLETEKYDSSDRYSSEADSVELDFKKRKYSKHYKNSDANSLTVNNEQDDLTDGYSSEVDSVESRNQGKSLDYDKCIEHSEFVQLLCKSVLGGSLKLQQHHINVLKPIRNTVRHIAMSSLRNCRRIIKSEIHRDQTTGASDLCTFLSTIIPVVNELVW